MKKLLLATVLMLGASASNASVLKICAAQATETCKELVQEDFYRCHNSEMQFCLEAIKSLGNKSNPECIEECLRIPNENEVEMCLRTCSPL